MTDNRTDRIVATILGMRGRIDSARKGSVTVDFANGSMSVKVTECIESPCARESYETRVNRS